MNGCQSLLSRKIQVLSEGTTIFLSILKLSLAHIMDTKEENGSVISEFRRYRTTQQKFADSKLRIFSGEWPKMLERSLWFGMSLPNRRDVVPPRQFASSEQCGLLTRIKRHGLRAAG